MSKRSYKEEFSSARTLGILANMVDAGRIDGDIVALLHDNVTELHTLLQQKQQPILQRYQDLQQEFMQLAGHA